MSLAAAISYQDLAQYLAIRPVMSHVAMSDRGPVRTNVVAQSNSGDSNDRSGWSADLLQVRLEDVWLPAASLCGKFRRHKLRSLVFLISQTR